MELADAYAVLGIQANAPYDAIRSHYRERLHELHPDHNGDRSSDATIDLIDAFATVRRDPRFAVSAASEVSSATSSDVGMPVSSLAWRTEPDTIVLACPADEAYLTLLAIAHRVGDVTYVDRQNQLFETLLRTVDGDTLSLVCTLQGRANGTTEAFLTLERFDIARGPMLSIADLTELILEYLVGSTG